MNRLSLFTLAFASANAAFLSKRQFSQLDEHLDSVCRPVKDSGLDMDAPCNAVVSIEYECTIGPGGGEELRSFTPDNDSDVEEEQNTQPKETQRVCICQSQFRDMVDGCMKCNEAHGGIEGNDWYNASIINEAMDRYCNVDTPATEDFATFFFKAVETNSTESSLDEPHEFSDPLANATSISQYFTASVTGTAAYIPALPTPESSGANVTYTISKTSGGQIVPTAAGDESEASSEVTQSSISATTSSEAGAMQTAMVHSGAFGAVGIAALLAAL